MKDAKIYVDGRLLAEGVTVTFDLPEKAEGVLIMGAPDWLPRLNEDILRTRMVITKAGAAMLKAAMDSDLGGALREIDAYQRRIADRERVQRANEQRRAEHRAWLANLRRSAGGYGR